MGNGKNVNDFGMGAADDEKHHVFEVDLLNEQRVKRASHNKDTHQIYK